MCISQDAKISLCRLMLDEMLQTLSASPLLSEIIVITKEQEALNMAIDHGAVVICDEHERGVNAAVSLADKHIEQNGIDATVVFPQDIPFTRVRDVEFLLRDQFPPNFVTIVPSRKFDGTNALVRMPYNIMGTCYDNDSYHAHVKTAKNHTRNWSVLFVDRIMMDMDEMEDLEQAVRLNEKPDLCRQIRALI